MDSVATFLSDDIQELSFDGLVALTVIVAAFLILVLFYFGLKTARHLRDHPVVHDPDHEFESASPARNSSK